MRIRALEAGYSGMRRCIDSSTVAPSWPAWNQGFDSWQEGGKPRRRGVAHLGECHDVLQDVLNVASSFGVGDVLDPNIRIHGIAGEPARHRHGSGIVRRKA